MQILKRELLRQRLMHGLLFRKKSSPAKPRYKIKKIGSNPNSYYYEPTIVINIAILGLDKRTKNTK